MDVGGHIDKNGKAPYTEYEGTIFFLVPGVDFGYAKTRSWESTNFAERQKEGYLWATSIKR